MVVAIIFIIFTPYYPCCPNPEKHGLIPSDHRTNEDKICENNWQTGGRAVKMNDLKCRAKIQLNKARSRISRVKPQSPHEPMAVGHEGPPA